MMESNKTVWWSSVRWVLFVLILAGLVGGLWYAMDRAGHQGASQGNQNQMPGVPVKVSVVRMQSVPVTLSALGTIVAPQAVTLRARVAGTIQAVFFHSGEHVKAHQVLFVIDQRGAQALLADQEAKLVQVKSVLTRYQRLKQTDPNAVSPSALEMYQAELKQQEALVAGAKEALRNTLVRAPFAGVVSAVATANNTALASQDSIAQIAVGSYLSVGDPLVDLIGTDQLTVVYSIPEEQASQLQLGQAVQVFAAGAIDNQGSMLASGLVSYISASVNPLSRTVTLHARLALKAPLKPGSFVSVRQILDPHAQAIVIPSIAVETQMEGFGVFQVREGKAIFSPITLGDRFGASVAVTSGLKAGDRIVTVGQDQLSEGMPVSVIS